MSAIWRPPHQSSMTEITVRWSDGRSWRISTAVSLEWPVVVHPPPRRRPLDCARLAPRRLPGSWLTRVSPGSVVEVAAEVREPFVGAGFGDVAGADAADDFGAVASTGSGHVEPAPSIRSAERVEVRGDLAVLVRPIADRQDQHVPFVALRSLCALDE